MKNKSLLIVFTLIFITAFFTYWKNYWKPEVFFWDENYHIASGAKYIEGTFFMEPHPPLGKLLIALGEKILDINNGQTFGYQKFDIIPNEALNPSFSFAGYRFFPALFSFLNIFIFSFIVFLVTQSSLITLSLSSLILFDNALILHSRGAMLEPFLIFGHLLAILALILILKCANHKNKIIFFYSSLLSLGCVFAFMTKLFGLALLCTWPLVYFFKKEYRGFFIKLFPIQFLFMFFLSISIWYFHIERSKKIEPSLMNNGLYYASGQYEKWLLGLEKDSLLNFPAKLFDHLRFISFYGKNVSALDLDEKNATGSYPIMWPFGSRAISYRWQGSNKEHRYLYLIPNPWTWALGLFALIISFSFLFKNYSQLKNESTLTSLFVLYLCYWIPMNFIQRVLYLYHYFPMLILSWLMLAVLASKLPENFTSKGFRKVKIVFFVCPIISFFAYWNFKNFIFYTPMSCSELETKKIFPAWGLKFPSCEEESLKNKKKKAFKDSFIQ